MKNIKELKDYRFDTGKFERDFDQITKIARGGFASVYKARHKVDQQIYAVKKAVLRIKPSEHSSIDEELERMLKEARLFAAINDPNIIRYNHSWIEKASVTEPQLTSEVPSFEKEESESDLDVELDTPFLEFAASSEKSNSSCDKSIENEDSLSENKFSSEDSSKISLYIQMELCKQTLQEYIEELNSKNSDLNDEAEYRRRLSIAYQVAKALRTIHQSHHMIHRDISLNNVFIAIDGTVKIGDFGLATQSTNLIPQKASPLGLRPIPGPETDSCDDSFKLCGLDDDEEDIEEPVKKELTHGLGTKSFTSPEQLSGTHYDQSTDIYSLGLVFFVIFYPTLTISERIVMLDKCRKEGVPRNFMQAHPEMGRLISSMVKFDPLERPNIETVIIDEAFASLHFEARLERAYSAPLKEDHVVDAFLKAGETGRWKRKFLRFGQTNLLVYNGREDEYAKLCYSLKECSVSKVGTAGELLEPLSAFEEHKVPLYAENNFFEDDSVEACIKIEHPDLETLYLRLGVAESKKVLELMSYNLMAGKL